jgi:predicted transcriptional regulator of viral defense system
VYRFPEVPTSEQDEYLEAVLLVGRGAVVSHESALGLLDLADVNPRMVHVTVPAGVRVRRQLTKPIKIHQSPLPDDDVTREDGIPVVTAARAIRDGLAAGTDSRLLAQAIVAGRREGYLTADEAAALEGARAGVRSRAEPPSNCVWG